MADATSPTFEEIDRHIREADLSAFEAGGKHHIAANALAANPAGVIAQICAVYRMIRPIIVAIANTPLFPANWRNAINVFIRVMDALCS